MSAAPPPNPLPPDEDRGPALMAMFWTWTGISIILVSVRLYVRSRIRGRGWDDWMMLLSVILLTLTSCFISYLASLGGSRHVWYLSDSQRLQALRWSWIVQPPSILIFATSKTSIAILQLRLVRRTSPWHRYTIYGVIAAVVIANVLSIVFTFAQCNPAYALWTPSLSYKCWNPDVQLKLNYFFAAINISADIVLAALPTTFVLSLSLPLSKRIGLCILLGFGIVAAIFGIIKAVYLSQLTKRGDFTWNAYPIQAWSGAEGFVLIFCGNLPPLQPLWDKVMKKKAISQYGQRGSVGRFPGTGPSHGSSPGRDSKQGTAAWNDLKLDSSQEDVPLTLPQPVMTPFAVSRERIPPV